MYGFNIYIPLRQLGVDCKCSIVVVCDVVVYFWQIFVCAVGGFGDAMVCISGKWRGVGGGEGYGFGFCRNVARAVFRAKVDGVESVFG